MTGVSVILPSRRRPESLHRSLRGLVDLAAEPGEIQVLVAADLDDEATCALGDRRHLGLDDPLPPQVTVYAYPRVGYGRHHLYVNHLAKLTSGEWVMLWNDDAVMLTPGWDKIITSAEPAILWPHANHAPHTGVFPAWPRAWSDAMGHVAPYPHIDTHLHYVGENLGKITRIPVEVLHDRADLTGNNDDLTYAEGRGRLGPEGMVPGWSAAAAHHAAWVDAQAIRRACLA